MSYKGHKLLDNEFLIEGDPEILIDLELKLDREFCWFELFKIEDLDKIKSVIDSMKSSTTRT